MGLPLFIAPVESDIKLKTADKTPGLQPSRPSIRRARRSDSRESRAHRRRAAILRETFPVSGAEQPGSRYIPPLSPERRARYPWIESGQLPPPEAYHPPGAAASNSTSQAGHGRATSRSRLLARNRIRDLFGDLSSTDNAPPNERSQLPTEHNSSRYARLLAYLRYPSQYGGDGDAYRRDRIAPSVAERFDRSPDRQLLAMRSQPPRTTRAAPLSQPRMNDLDGLGDRTRSPSPRDWDLLLSTLTPDPQPPSVGSSFASASASAATSQQQSAAASSRTSIGAGELADDLGLDQPCEHSDSEYEPSGPVPPPPPPPPPGPYPSRHQRFVSGLSGDVPSRAPMDPQAPTFSALLEENGPIRSRLLELHSQIGPRLGLPPLNEDILSGGTAQAPAEERGDEATGNSEDAENQRGASPLSGQDFADIFSLVQSQADRGEPVPFNWWHALASFGDDM